MNPRDVAPGGTATLSFLKMPRPATCTPTIDYPGDVPSATLATQTATWISEADGYGMSWAFVVPANTPAGSATARYTCTYPGTSLPPGELGFFIVP